jgi:ABC-type lipoprotein release transport system permease subunit
MPDHSKQRQGQRQATIFLLTTVSLLACLFPAKRAMKVDPVAVIKYE